MSGKMKDSYPLNNLEFLDDLQGDSDFAVISAALPHAGMKENYRRHCNLVVEARKYGYYILVIQWLENGSLSEEELLFLPNIREKEAIELGRRYDQASILFKNVAGFFELTTSEWGDHGIGETIRFYSRNARISEKDFAEAFSQWRQGDRTSLNTQTSSSQLMSLRAYVHRVVFAANPDGSRPKYLVYDYKG